MASLNQATIIGYVGDVPKISNTQNGRKVASFAIATTEKGYTSKSGVQYPDRTEWHNIVLWGNLAEIAEKYLRKGSSVFIQGKMRTRSYDDKNGVKRYITEIEGETMQMLDRRADNATSPSIQNDVQPGTAISRHKYLRKMMICHSDSDETSREYHSAELCSMV